MKYPSNRSSSTNLFEFCLEIISFKKYNFNACFKIMLKLMFKIIVNNYNFNLKNFKIVIINNNFNLNFFFKNALNLYFF